MKAVVWSNIGCHFCEQAKTLLKQFKTIQN